MPSKPDVATSVNSPVVLVAGATGYVGRRLVPQLEQQQLMLRCLARDPAKLRPLVASSIEVVRGDVLERSSLDAALAGVTTAYYLVHLMSGSRDFERDDRQAAMNFANAARDNGIARIIYLGGLGDDHDPKLSPHLRSRHEVGQVLRDSGVETIEFRASLVVGAGSLSFDLVQSLTRSAARNALPEVALDAHATNRGGGCAGLFAGCEGPAPRPEPDRRNRRRGRADVWRHHPRICATARFAALADFRAGVNALPI
jgi:uncharacterized protein YbjT (DUF2867 family)